jgi:hypothetical protein
MFFSDIIPKKVLPLDVSFGNHVVNLSEVIGNPLIKLLYVPQCMGSPLTNVL